MKKFKTYLPLFPGFYNTIFEPNGEDCEIDEINRQRLEKNLTEINYDDCNFNYKDYEKNMSEDMSYKIAEYLESIFGEKIDITFEKVVSPKFYNFSNDSINIEIAIDLNLVINYLESNLKEFKDYIKNKYTSYDGFISSYSNDGLNWLNDIKTIDFESSHKLGSILDFILINEDYEAINLIEDCTDSNYLYAENYDELINA